MVVGEVAVEVDVVIIGGGPGGYSAAIRLGQLGKTVVLIEKDKLGGVCLNRGCIPSKALIYTAEKVDQLHSLQDMGVDVSGERPKTDLKVWQEWKESITAKLSKGVHQLCDQHKGITTVKGEANFLSNNRIGVETGGDFEIYKFENSIIATGSRPIVPSFVGNHHANILDSTSILALEDLPSSLTIVGGGYIGVEIGMALAKLGTVVTIIELSERILPATAKTLSKEVVMKAKEIGIKIVTSAMVTELIVSNDGVELIVSTKDGEQKFQSSKVLITVGRKPNTEELGLNQLGIVVENSGHIEVDEECRTSQDNIFAIGDVTIGPALAHKASKEGKIAAEVISGLPSAMDTSLIPYVIFTDPQIAGVGMTEEEAKQKGYQIKKGKFPFSANGIALISKKPAGFAEVIVDAETHVLLGFHVVGSDASNLISEGTLALELGARVEDLALTIHPHPTLTEAWLEAAEAALGHAIHSVNR